MKIGNESLMSLLFICFIIVICGCKVKKFTPNNFNEIFKNFIKLPGSNNTLISKYEVSISDYNRFINSEGKTNPDFYKENMIHSTKWFELELEGMYKDTQKRLVEPLARNYSTYEFYQYYPVVNVSYKAAINYCTWMSLEINKYKYKDDIKVRLPTLDEYKLMMTAFNIQVPADTLTREQLYETKYRSDINLKYHFYNEHLSQYSYARVFDGYFIQGPIFHNPQSDNNICSVIGNVSEMIDSTSTFGGNWDSFPNDVFKELPYNAPDPRIGFRIVLEIVD